MTTVEAVKDVGFLTRLRRMRPPQLRSYQQFAEEEIVMPDGPFKGFRYSTDTMPFSKDLLREFWLGRYRAFFGSGPAQASKTLHFCIIPTVYHLCEAEEDVLFGAPTVSLAKAAFEARILPTIRASRYRDLLPASGAGSRGGIPDALRLKNGALVRFLGAGGGDHQIAGYTSRVVVATELDKMDDAGLASDETDPVSKLRARSASFGRLARFFGECTMSVKTGRIYREVVELGTDSRVHLPCPHCKAWVWPERTGLVGWSMAATELEAMAGARFQCPECQGLWTEADRREALRNPRIVARGQTVNAAGEVEGALPATLTYGFRWNCMASPLKDMADVAAKHWRHERTGVVTEEKELLQYEWVEPYEESTADLINPDEAMIIEKITPVPQYVRGVIPEGTLKLTLAVDVGSIVIWWSLVAWLSEARGHVVDFKGIDVLNQPGEKRNPLRVLEALRRFRDEDVKRGWGGRMPDRILVDSGFEQEVVYKFILESGQPRWLACKGYGSSNKSIYPQPSASERTELRGVGNEWRDVVQPTGIRRIDVNSDHWKAMVHDGFWAAHGAYGSITLFAPPAMDPEGKERQQLGIFARQICAEQRRYVEKENKERRVEWAVISRRNHYLDCMAYNRCAADIEGVRLASVAPARPWPPPAPRPPVRTIRTRY